MGILEYDIQTAKLQAEITVLNKAVEEYKGTASEKEIVHRLNACESQLNALIISAIPF